MEDIAGEVLAFFAPTAAVVVCIFGLVFGFFNFFFPEKKEVVPPKPKETIPHILGRKTKDAVLEFGKGVISK